MMCRCNAARYQKQLRWRCAAAWGPRTWNEKMRYALRAHHVDVCGGLMVTVGVIARFEAKPGTRAEIERFFHNGLSIVEKQPFTTVWFAFRTGPTSYGAFAAFESDADREALLSAGGPKLSAEFANLFAQPPSFEKADVLEARYVR